MTDFNLKDFFKNIFRLDNENPNSKVLIVKFNLETSKGRVKKKLEFFNFVGDPPPPPLKLENIQFFLHDP